MDSIPSRREPMQKQKPLSPLWIDMVGARRNGMPSASHSSQSATKTPFSIPVHEIEIEPEPTHHCFASRNGAVIIDVVHLLDALRIVRREPNEYDHADYRYRPVQ